LEGEGLLFSFGSGEGGVEGCRGVGLERLGFFGVVVGVEDRLESVFFFLLLEVGAE
jgi:hypothetical protein